MPNDRDLGPEFCRAHDAYLDEPEPVAEIDEDWEYEKRREDEDYWREVVKGERETKEAAD